MTKWHLVIDIERCGDCNNCFLACKDEHVDNEWPGYTDSQPLHGHRWINILRKERGQYPQVDVAYRPTPCMHCDEAPCIAAAENQAISKRDDGIVLIDPGKAKGQKALLKSCPYGAIWWNEEKNVPQKCTLCAHLLDQGWRQPRCVQACPTGALQMVAGTDNEMAAMAADQDLAVLYPELNTRPRVFYRNSHRFQQCFVAGSVCLEKQGVIDCLQGVRIVLKKNEGPNEGMNGGMNGGIVAEAVSDAFGDFKFDGLPENSGWYQLEIHCPNAATQCLEVEVKTSVSMEPILIRS